MSPQENPSFFTFPQVHVVEASAGSGKTYSLAKRYVQLLLNPRLPAESNPFRTILAVTFTNKAAFEMKERILEFLKRIALEQLTPSEIQQLLEPLGLDAKTAGAKAFAIMDELILHYNFFQVQTIDSFINALLSGCAFKIGLSANFKIKRNSRDYLELGLDRLIDRAHSEPPILTLFENLLHQYLYLENRSSWFPKKDILSLMGSLFSQLNTYGLRYEDRPASSAEILEVKKGILEQIRELRENFPLKTDKKFEKSLDTFLAKANFGFDVEWVSDYFARDFFPANKGAEVPAKIDRLWEEIRRNLQRLCEIESKLLFNGYIEIFNRVLKNVKLAAAREDILFLEELNKKARLLFDEDAITVAELYYRLAMRFRHYLIDEFQDTSSLQWKNLEVMVEEALSTGGSLFYVGDRKQAIYGFRGGEIRLFDQVQDQFRIFNVIEETLSTNYRSQKNVVEFNNSVFSPENLLRFMNEKETFELEKKKKNSVYFSVEEKQRILDVFQNSRQDFLPDRGEGYVKVEFIDSDLKEERDMIVEKKIVQLVRELKTRFSLNEIAVLARNNNEVELVTSWLLRAGISVESERTSNIKENFLIKELISFLRFLESPVDNLSFASFILGDIFIAKSGLDPQALSSFVFSLRSRITKEKDFYIYKEFRAKYPRLWDELIEDFFKNVGLFPLYELILSIANRYQCMANFPQFQGYLMRFLEIIKDQEEDHSDLASFLEYFETVNEDLFLNITDSNTVRILTIHKSKGLEFPVVIIPFLGMDIQVGSGGAQGEKTYVLHPSDQELELLHMKQKYLSFSPHLDEIYRREYQKSFVSELNNVYVALTRSALELYVFIPKRIGSSLNFVRFLIPDEIWEKGKKAAYPVRPSKKDKLMIKVPLSNYGDWIDLLKDEFVDIERLRNAEKLKRGELVHALLSSIGRVIEGQEDLILQQAISLTSTRFSLGDETQTLEAVLRQVLGTPELRRFFYVEDGQVFQEKEIVDPRGQGRRIDRLIVTGKFVWIVDYKSHRVQHDLHRRQIRDYMKIVEELYPGREVKGFLIYLDQLQVEEVSALSDSEPFNEWRDLEVSEF